MSATNHTSNYELSQYIGSDEPKYLTDYNGDMQKIDVAIKEAKTGADTANTGVATNAASIQTLDGAVSSLNGQVSTVATATNGNTASINTINSLIGNGEPTTSDKTIIGAINEIYADITGGGTDIEADNVKYDNTTSGLTADDVQEAIDEIVSTMPSPTTSLDADHVNYDNQTSGLTATNVQSAIDELAQSTPVIAEHGFYELWANADPTQSFGAQNIVINDYDVTKFDAIIIEYENDKDESMGGRMLVVDDAKLVAVSPHNSITADYIELSVSSGKLYDAAREFSFAISGTTLTISVAQATRYTLNSYGTAATGSASDDYVIPVRVLGLRHNS